MASMTCDVVKVSLDRIQPLRTLFLQESNSQVRYDACHARGWTDSYLLTADSVEAGYGSIKGDEPQDRDTVFEFFVTSPFRSRARALFERLLTVSGAVRVECQSNHPLLTAMLFEFGRDINASAILFDHDRTMDLVCPGAVVRERRGNDRMFEHTAEPVGDLVLELDESVVASGGFLTHYNEPFADLFIEVEQGHRRKGVGSFLVQEIIKRCYLAGRVPAARCGLQNAASRATLTRAGMRPSGFMLAGAVRK
jgi:GNAT superfamily N-acetyltransferase